MTGFLRQRLTGMRTLRMSDRALALGLFAVCVVAYVPAMSSSVVPGDGGEFQMVSQVLGVAHPSGYPLFTLLGWLFGHIPLGGGAAWRVTFLCVLAAAAAMSLFYLLLRELGAGVVAALFAAALALSSTNFWIFAATTDPSSLSSFFIVLLWLLLVRWAKGTIPLWAAGLALGLGLTHHITMRLIAPAALAFVLAVQPGLLRVPRRWLVALACMLLPLLLYLYVPLRAGYFAQQPWLAGEIVGVRKTVASGLVTPHYYAGGAPGLILALDYSEQFAASNTHADWAQALADYLGTLGRQFPLLTLPFMALGLLLLVRRQPRAGLLLLLSFGFVLVPALGETAVWRDCIPCGKHFIPTYLLMALLLGMCADGLIAWVAERKLPWLKLLTLTILIAVVVANVVLNVPVVLAQRVVDHSLDVLRQPLPQGAVITGDWSIVTPLRYHQRVDAVRPDLWIIHADSVGTGLLMQRALASKTPFYTVRSTPAGGYILPLPAPADQPVTHAADIGLGSAVRWRGYDLSPEAAHAGGVIEITLYWQVLARPDRNWKTFIHMLDARAEKVAQVDSVPMAEYSYPPPSWQPGQFIADPYTLQLPSTLAPGSYRLIFGWYEGAERLRWADGADAQPLAEITIR